MPRSQPVALLLLVTLAAIHISPSTCRSAIYLHYAFDGNAVDSVGGRNGTLIGDATFSSNVAPGIGSTQSLALDGTLDKVIYDTAAADILSGSFTVALWANVASRRPAGTLTFVGTRGPGNQFGTDFKYRIDRFVRLDIGNGISGFLTISDTPVSYNLNEWHHLAVTVTPTGYTLYFDGNPINSVGFAGTPLLLDAGHDLAVGAIDASLVPNGPPTGEDFHGLIDDFRIYDTALSASEVAALFAPVPEVSALLTWMLLGFTTAKVRYRACVGNP
jgi:hypothetical protein